MSASRATRAADQMVADKPDQAKITAALSAAGVSDDDIAKMIKSTRPKPPKFNVKRHVATALIASAADLAENWNPADHEGIERDTATALIAKYVHYARPGTWDDRLGERPKAGTTVKVNGDDDDAENESE